MGQLYPYPSHYPTTRTTNARSLFRVHNQVSEERLLPVQRPCFKLRLSLSRLIKGREIQALYAGEVPSKTLHL